MELCLLYKLNFCTGAVGILGRIGIMEKDKLIHAVSWSVLYLIVYGILTVIGNFLFSDEFIIVCGLAGGIYILINAFFIKYKRERLFINGFISALQYCALVF